ncbi:MAG: acyl-CoA dehydrogenase [Nitrospinae bacterium]|nr:acyl-CoA dehydrogenase [Nitrospinota bacterium]
MNGIAFLFAAVATGAVLAYFNVPLMIGTFVLGALLAAFTWSFVWGPAIYALWVAFIALALVLNIHALRRALISNHVLKLFRKLMPPISQTEREALEAGTVWWEKDLFSGKPDWKKLLGFPAPKLTAEEQAFLDGPVENLCSMINDWEVTDRLKDLPKEAWDYIKKERFFGLIITKEYGGLEFSALAHSEVVQKLASKSITAAVTVMVPNSLGPAELLLHYGTDEQKKRYLPGLAIGTEIPCFALTEPQAGSDASSITSFGVIETGMFGGKEVLGMRVNWEKRYITLSSVATVMGLAFKLYDPNRLLGDKEDIGITVALVPTNTPGISIGNRHDPLSIPFHNGTIRGKDVFMPLNYIVGGPSFAGKGWQMLMERLSIGRGISLPALGASASKTACRGTGAYARIRRQFRLPVARMEGVEEALTFIAGHTYAVDATRRFTVGAIDAGQRPSLASAIAKYNITERMRMVVNHAMDVQGGAAIVLGPRNFMGRAYQSIPISITVEGANILTRTLIVFGQGVIRAHPYVLKEMEAAAEKDPQKASAAFDSAFFSHAGFTLSTAMGALVSGLTGGALLPAPVSGPAARHYRQFGRMSAAFALASDVAMLALGGKLKRMEKLTGRLADAISNLYIASAVLKRFEDEGRKKEDEALMRWACEDALFRIQTSLDGFLRNLPNRPVAAMLRLFIFPCGRPYHAPSDRLGGACARILLAPSESRDRLTAGIHVPHNTQESLGRIEDALVKVIRAEAVEKKVLEAARAKKLKSLDPAAQVEEAEKLGVISAEEKKIVAEAEAARLDVVTVDEFPKDYWSGRHDG